MTDEHVAHTPDDSLLRRVPHPPLELLKDSFVRRYQELLGDRYERFLLYSFSYARKSVRVNTLKMSVEELKKRLSVRWELTPVPWCAEGFWIAYQGDGEQEERFDIGNLVEHALGYVYVQDAASMIPPVVLNPLPGSLVLDMCAAPGSKATQLSAMMKNTGLVVANDAQTSRLQPLAVNLQRMGVSNAIVTRMVGQQFARKSTRYDYVLLDAPCSGTGTIRRTSKVLRMWSPGLIKRLVKEQRSLIQSAFAALKEGGVLVYSTCTQEPEENEGVVSWLVKNNPDAVVLPIELPLNRSAPIMSFGGEEYEESVRHALRIYPYDNDTEGFFVCKITKNPTNNK